MRKGIVWGIWAATAILGMSYMTYRLTRSDRRVFLPGDTSHGHYQIELKCDACHTPSMGVRQESCLKCHAEDLKNSNDSHSSSKFNDPRNADRLAALNAAKCVTCHSEHRPERTHSAGVTLPTDFCFKCHAEIYTERPSHKGFAFQSCSTSGCHKFHDNTALYTDFLIKHFNEPNLKLPATVALRTSPVESKDPQARGLTRRDANAPTESMLSSSEHVSDWESTAHAKSGVNCRACHETLDPIKQTRQWNDKPGYGSCIECHKTEYNGFAGGRHGMRIAQDLSPMTPRQARQPMKLESYDREVNCGSCHGAHRFDTKSAAVDSCLACHNDTHSLAYKHSVHYSLWQRELAGLAAEGSGVSCATCHLPRENHGEDGHMVVNAQHNQNNNLRPNEKMIRGVCMQCHGLAFSIDALADKTLAQRNFEGHPSAHIRSTDMAVESKKPKTQEKQR